MQKRLLWVLLLNNLQLGTFRFTIEFNKKYFALSNFFSGLLLARFPHIYFIKTDVAYKSLRCWLVKNLRTKSMYTAIAGFRWSRFILFSGLGYKRRFYRKFRVAFNYIADRHWILYRFSPHSALGPHRRRNFVLYSFYKGGLTDNYDFFSSLRRPYVYKMKGFIDARVRGRFLFVRRIKIRGVRTKLSKKQKLL